MQRIIDNKRLDLTADEFKLYQDICTSYDRPNFKGEDLFKGLFETDDRGRIIMLRPPNKKYTSMEVYLFLVNVMIHQHLGDACNQVDALMVEGKKLLLKVENALKDLEKAKEETK
jgi:hypothetical protein